MPNGSTTETVTKSLSRLVIGSYSRRADAAVHPALMVFIGGAEMFLPRTRLGQALERSSLPVAIDGRG